MTAAASSSSRSSGSGPLHTPTLLSTDLWQCGSCRTRNAQTYLFCSKCMVDKDDTHTADVGRAQKSASQGSAADRSSTMLPGLSPRIHLSPTSGSASCPTTPPVVDLCHSPTATHAKQPNALFPSAAADFVSLPSTNSHDSIFPSIFDLSGHVGSLMGVIGAPAAALASDNDSDKGDDDCLGAILHSGRAISSPLSNAPASAAAAKESSIAGSTAGAPASPSSASSAALADAAAALKSALESATASCGTRPRGKLCCPPSPKLQSRRHSGRVPAQALRPSSSPLAMLPGSTVSLPVGGRATTPLLGLLSAPPLGRPRPSLPGGRLIPIAALSAAGPSSSATGVMSAPAAPLLSASVSAPSSAVSKVSARSAATAAPPGRMTRSRTALLRSSSTLALTSTQPQARRVRRALPTQRSTSAKPRAQLSSSRARKRRRVAALPSFHTALPKLSMFHHHSSLELDNPSRSNTPSWPPWNFWTRPDQVAPVASSAAVVGESASRPSPGSCWPGLLGPRAPLSPDPLSLGVSSMLTPAQTNLGSLVPDSTRDPGFAAARPAASPRPLAPPSHYDHEVRFETISRTSRVFSIVSEKFLRSFSDCGSYSEHGEPKPCKHRTGPCGRPVVLKIEVVQARDRLEVYEMRKRQLRRRVASANASSRSQPSSPTGGTSVERDINERWLFHGTSSEVARRIAHQGFLRQFQNANMIGKGSYFAERAQYSADRRYSKLERGGSQVMFLCRVLCGDYHTGSQDLIQPDDKPGAKHCPHESTVDSVYLPSIWCTYLDDQAYPEFLIHFKMP